MLQHQGCERFPHACLGLSCMNASEVRGNIFLFHFDSASEKLRILDGSPWKYMRLSKAARISTFFPSVLDIALPKDNSPLWRDFFRMRVKVNITDSLPAGFNTQGAGDKVANVAFHYEDLGDFCYYCGKVGHVEKDRDKCFNDKRAGKKGRHRACYRPHLRAKKSYARCIIGGKSKAPIPMEDDRTTMPWNLNHQFDGEAVAREPPHPSTSDTGPNAVRDPQPVLAPVSLNSTIPNTHTSDSDNPIGMAPAVQSGMRKPRQSAHGSGLSTS
ncbi:hypothetical protein Tsubulata_028083 [Turnera subulata]|uniref:Zinc knuckle CX2CX4HX4C domain-containing protein n=1 Tax=Turnera subulata TaxID=218843 RepID=A0A9Q0GIM0_9ROSI|nr:hypothetical protein Tsubulata_028083 [Turnera subulata]